MTDPRRESPLRTTLDLLTTLSQAPNHQALQTQVLDLLRDPGLEPRLRDGLLMWINRQWVIPHLGREVLARLLTTSLTRHRLEDGPGEY